MTAQIVNLIRGGRIVHGIGCPDPTLKGVAIKLDKGDQPRVTCRGCRVDYVADPVPTPAVAPTFAPSLWRCREHPDRPVTWRGTGCPQCERKSRKRHAASDTETTRPNESGPTERDVR